MTKVEWFLIFLNAFLLVGLVWSEKNRTEEHERLMTQCINDGHKEYYCEGLLRKERLTAPLIIFH